MSDLGDMIVYEIGKTVVKLVVVAAVVFGGIGFLIGKFL